MYKKRRNKQPNSEIALTECRPVGRGEQGVVSTEARGHAAISAVLTLGMMKWTDMTHLSEHRAIS